MSFFDFASETPPKMGESALWTEKYRPKSVDTLLGNEQLKENVARYLETNDLPHLLLFGVQGGGKSSIARILRDGLECDYLYINASDENSIDTIRTKIKGFCQAVPMRRSNLKVAFLEEADFLTMQAQAAMRNLIEEFQETVRFVLTCNHIEKLHPAILSRMQTYEVEPPTKQALAQRLVEVLREESVEFAPEDVAEIVKAYFPDVRRCIGALQRSSTGGTLVLDKDAIVSSDVKGRILDVLTTNKNLNAALTEVREIVQSANVKDFTGIYRYLYTKIDAVPKGKIAQFILALAEGEYRNSIVVDREITFAATFINLHNVLHG